MKKKLFFSILFLALVNLLIFSEDNFKISYEQLSGSEMIVNFDITYYNFSSKFANNELYSEIVFEGGVKTIKKGYAELPYIGTAVQLPQDRDFTYEVVRADYEDYYLAYPLLPSKGEIFRNQNPDEIAYEIDPASLNEEWFPTEVVDTTAPFIFRDVRGTNIYLYPFQYNAAKRMVRVYKKVQVKVVTDSLARSNAMPLSDAPISSEMAGIYNSLFINYNAPLQSENLRYANEIGEQGELLVIYTARDKAAIQPYIQWKREKGFQVYEKEVAKGTNVKTLIQNEYNANRNILYVQLVGDFDDVQSDTTNQSGKICPTDPALGFVAGNDSYPDLIIGRFSANNPAEVTVQVNKAINYEKNARTTDTWYNRALGIASHEGGTSGDDQESDFEHMAVIKTNKLLPFTYTEVDEAYKQVSTSVSTTSVNKGVSLINYVGHGSETHWVTSNFTSSAVNGLTNGDKLPFIISVACVVGKFNRVGDSFAEVWLKKQNGGAVVGIFSTINQPWTPPMKGQDYMNDLLTGGYNYATKPGNGTSTTQGRTTFGSIAFNGMVLMYAEAGASARETLISWTIFGDASVQVRTDKPATVTLSSTAVAAGQPFTTTVKDAAGRGISGMRVALSQNGTVFSALTDGTGRVTLNHTFTSGSVKLVATGFNKATVYQTVTVGGGTGPINETPLANFSFSANKLAVSFTDKSIDNDGRIVKWAWAFGDGKTSTLQNPTNTYAADGTYTVELTVTDDKGATAVKTASVTVSSGTTPVNEKPVADFSAAAQELKVSFTDKSTDKDGTVVKWAWAFGDGKTSTLQNPVYTYAADGTYTVELTVTDDKGATGVKSMAVTVKKSGGTGTCTYPAWVKGQVYDKATVCHNGRHWYAQWWTTAEPGTTGQWGAWEDKGACGGTGPVQNIAPQVNITAPLNNASVTAPANVQIVATATDADGTVVSVEVFNGATKLGAAKLVNGKYTFDLANLAEGTYSYKVVATDDKGATAQDTVTVVVKKDNGGTTPTNEWKVGVAYKVGDIVTFGGKTYKCGFAHTSLQGWEPNVAHALWSVQ